MINMINISKNICYDWIHMVDSYTQLVNKKDIVLEIGASNMERTKELSKHCHKVIGIEYFADRKPSNFSNVEYYTGDWQELTKYIQENSIDIAISSHVIEHVPDDIKAINELHKVLKSDGIAIINTPNRRRLTRIIIESFKGKRKFPYWEHIREYSHADINNMLQKTLFKDSFKIIPVAFGVNGGKARIYIEKPPKMLQKWGSFWEIHLKK